MKRLLGLLVMIGAANAQPDAWTALRVFEGKWEGSTEGRPGKGTTSREFRLELNGHFLSQRDKSVYQTADPGKPLIHEDFGFFSVDKATKKVMWRQFLSEGFVHEYTLESISADGASLAFVTQHTENLPDGFRAKKVYRIVSKDEIAETFLIAQPGKDFEVYTEARIKRVR